MGMVDRRPGDEPASTRWTSGPATPHERMELVQFLAERRVPNPVVLTGDIHSNWVNDLRVDDREARDARRRDRVRRHVDLQRRQRDPDAARACDVAARREPLRPVPQRPARLRPLHRHPRHLAERLLVVEDVTRPGAPAVTQASFVVEAGQPGAHAV